MRQGAIVFWLLDWIETLGRNLSLSESVSGGDMFAEMSVNDRELLEQFVNEQSQLAFAALVGEHIDLVYSAALRQIRSPQFAEEITQCVFMDLARQAKVLNPETILPAWLYQVTRRTAVDVIRRESRRQARERASLEIAAMNDTTADWLQLEPLLDEAMETLAESDRTAILLRYFQNQSLREVGTAFGITDDAAQKRVSRAVGQLREFFNSRGTVLGLGTITLAISANANQAAPVGFAALISTKALTASSVAAATAASAIKTIAMTTTKKSLISAVIILTVSAGLFELRQNNVLRTEIGSLRQQQLALNEQLNALAMEHQQAINRLSSLAAEMSLGKSNNAELLKLRAEITQLSHPLHPHASAADATTTAADAWATRVKSLKARLDATPSARTADMQLLTEDDWLNAARSSLTTEDDYRRALSSLRGSAAGRVASQMQIALQSFQSANNNQFPMDISQLKPYLITSLNDDILQNWSVVPASEVSNLRFGGSNMITQKSAVDLEYDQRYGIGPNGMGSAGGEVAWNTQDREVGQNLIKTYAADHDGAEPTDPAQLMDYATNRQQQAFLNRFIQKTKAAKANP